MSDLKLTDCDVLVAATLATISIAPRETADRNNGPYVERAMAAFDHMLVEIARRGGTATMRAEACLVAEKLLKG